MTTTKLTLTITRSGMERFTAAQLGEDIDLTVTSVGLTDSAFVSAPTLEALPGEFRRLNAVSGEQVGDNIVHMTIRDDEAIGFTARGLGLFLADGTLFASYGQPLLLFEKSPRAVFFAAIDIAFPTGDVSELTFGGTDFLNPPATSTRKGVTRFALPDEIHAGVATDVAITPEGLRRALPIGAIWMWYGSTATVPMGWAICDGRTVGRSDGAGDIVTPDMRGRVPMGAGLGFVAGEEAGARERSADTTDAGEHSHSFQWSGATGSSIANVALQTKDHDVDAGGSSATLRSVTITDPGHSHELVIDARTGVSDQHRHAVTIDVTQPSRVLLFIMRI